MKVAIIGSGAQGTGLAGLLAMEDDVERIIIADYSVDALKASEKKIKEIGSRIKTKEILYMKVNAGDVQDVARVISGSDICFHAILPKFNLPIMKACLKEKVNYLDLIALPCEGEGMPKEEEITAQIELDREFEKAGILAIPSVGISPGWTLFAAADMMKNMEKINEVVIRWSDYIDTDEYTCSINPGFMFSEWLGAPGPSAWRNGDVVGEDLLDSEEEFEFPEPIGRRKIYTCTSQPDIVMIPMFSDKEIPYCVEKGGVNLKNMDPLHVWMKGIQMASSIQGYTASNINMIEEFSKNMIPPTKQDEMVKDGRIRDRATCFSVEVKGLENGRTVRRIQYNNCTQETAQKHISWCAPAVYDTVGGLPIILILMIGRGQLRRQGVITVGQLGMNEQIKSELIKRDQDITEKVIYQN